MSDERLEIDIIATDKASQIIGDVADEVAELDGEGAEVDLDADDDASDDIENVEEALDELDGEGAEVSVEVDDQASSPIEGILTNIDGLTAEEKEVVLRGEAKALEREIDKALGLLRTVDEADAEAVISAKDEAQGKLDAVQAALADLDGDSAEVDLEADDDASPDIEDVEEAVGDLDGESAEVDLEANADDAEAALDSITELLGNIPGLSGAAGAALVAKAGPIAAVAALATALGIAGKSAADWAIEVDKLVQNTGSTHEIASRILTVWNDNDLDETRLNKSILRLQENLRENPELARALGTSLDEVRENPLAALISAVDTLTSGQLSATEAMEHGIAAFGLRGYQELQDLINVVSGRGGLQETLDGVNDSVLVTEDDAERAREIQRTMQDLGTHMSGIGQTIGNRVVPVLADAAGTVERLVGAFDLLIQGRPGDAFDKFFGPSGGDFISTWAREFETGAERFQDWANWFLNEFPAELASGNPLEQLNFDWDTIAGGLEVTEEQARALVDALIAGVDPAQAWADVMGDAADAAGDAAAAGESYEDTLTRVRDEADEAAEANKRLLDSYDAMGDAWLQARAANRDLRSQMERTNEVLADGTASADEQEEAVDRLITAALRQADAAVAVTEATAERNGESLTATQVEQVHARALLDTASTLSGPARQALLNHIFLLHDIPTDVRTEIEAAVDRGDIDEANRLLNDASRKRKAAIEVDANAATVRQADRQIDAVARSRTAPVTATANTAAAERALNAVARNRVTTFTGSAQFRAHGDPFTNEGEFIVGEQGPERVRLPRGSSITANHHLGRALGESGGPMVEIGTINVGDRRDAGAVTNAIDAAMFRYRYGGLARHG